MPYVIFKLIVGLLKLLFKLIKIGLLTIWVLVNLIGMPLLVYENIKVGWNDETCFTQANRKKMMRDYSKTIINMLPIYKSGGEEENYDPL